MTPTVPAHLRYKLHFGPYRAPRFKLGAKVKNELRGEVTIDRSSDGHPQANTSPTVVRAETSSSDMVSEAVA